MNLTNRNNENILKKYSTTKQSHQDKYLQALNMELLCNEIQKLARESETLEAQYKTIVSHYQNLTRQVIA